MPYCTTHAIYKRELLKFRDFKRFFCRYLCTHGTVIDVVVVASNYIFYHNRFTTRQVKNRITTFIESIFAISNHRSFLKAFGLIRSLKIAFSGSD